MSEEKERYGQNSGPVVPDIEDLGSMTEYYDQACADLAQSRMDVIDVINQTRGELEPGFLIVAGAKLAQASQAYYMAAMVDMAKSLEDAQARIDELEGENCLPKCECCRKRIPESEPVVYGEDCALCEICAKSLQEEQDK